MNRLSRLLLLCCAALLLVACGKGRVAAPDVRVMVVNAASTHPSLGFLREQRTEANLPFLDAGTFNFDADQYEFNITTTLPGRSLTETVATFDATLAEGNDYYMVLAEVGGLIEPLVVEHGAFPVDANDAEIIVAHAAEGFADVDVYVEAAGADLANATPIGRAGFLDVLAPATRAAGDYRLYLTQAGNASVVLLESAVPSLASGSRNLFVLTTPKQGIAELVVAYASNTTASLLYDGAVESAARFVNGVTDRGDRDVYLDQDFAMPLVAALGHAGASDFQAIAADSHTFSITPVGNVGTVELEGSLITAQGLAFSVLVGGDIGDLTADIVLGDRRPLFDRARLELFNATSLFETIDVYFLSEGRTVDNVLSDVRSLGPAIHQAVFAPGDYDLVVRQVSSGTTLTGPLPLTLEAGKIYGVLLLDAVDAATVDVVLFDDFETP